MISRYSYGLDRNQPVPLPVGVTVTSNAKPRLASLRGRLGRLAAVFTLTFAGLFAIPLASGTAYAATPTIDCDQASQLNNQQERNDWTTCQQLVGTAACVWDNTNGSYTIALGYNNPTSSNLYASIPAADGTGGTNNKLTATGGTANDPDHISTFWASQTSVTAFTVTWYPTSRKDPVAWNLMGKTYQFTQRSAPACTTKPVPIMGSMGAVGATLGLLLVAFVFINRRQLRRLRRTPWLHSS
jgi:hypothetical protein